MKNNIVRIGTRGSALALYQANQVKLSIETNFPDVQAEIVIIHTKGDKILDVALSKIGDKGLFTKELEVALLSNEVDMAVHSLKDLPTFFPEGLQLGAVLPRAEVRDALVSKNGKTLKELGADDVIATSSLRRKAQLLAYNPEFQIVDIRGNVNTRLSKMDNGYCDAMIMAAAGLQRLNLDERITEIIDPENIIPAVSQGIIAIETRSDDERVAAVMSGINHQPTLQVAIAERAFLKAMDGGCQVPIGCYSEVSGDVIVFTGFVSDLKGEKTIRLSKKGQLNDARAIALEISAQMAEQGAKEILDEIRKNSCI
ncbi:hydroxymethylbilane synthase [Paludibacter sp.]|uniref:hydroxymethylbilane synthase n=1 Tax=Paludibacter sp. TaxID=1898105 RepID=UPI0013544BAD|nr:hydroxymethylbilane synthase [Paludibacter sp.]MTK52258.1 hydroxymethylbilane synthase [Paludibacter sp.]